MAYVAGDRVRETTTTTGTGAVTLAGAVSGFRAFSAIAANGDRVPYVIAGGAEWEVGIGTWQTGGILARTTVIHGSAGAGTAVNFSAGTKEVFLTPAASRVLHEDHEGAVELSKTTGNVIPATPPADILKLFARTRAGRLLLHEVGPAGVDVALQPALFGNTVVLYIPNPTAAATVANALGTLWTARNAGTGAAQTQPAPTSTNAISSLQGTEFSTGTTATGSSGIQSALQFWRGNAAGLGGWFFHARFGLPAFSGTWRLLVGLAALNGALAAEPSTLANVAALVKDAGDTNFQILTRDASAGAKLDTGVAPVAGNVYDLFIFTPPNGASITFRLANAVTGAVLLDDTVRNTNLPVNTTFLAIHAQLMSVTTTTAKTLRVARMYLEADL